MNKKLSYLLIILIAGILVRIVFIYYSPKTLFWDESSYTGIAESFMRGNYAIDCCHKGPGFPIILGILNTFFGSGNLISASILNVFFDTFTTILIYLIGSKLFGFQKGLLAAIFFAINPFTNAYIGFILPESFTMFMLMGIISLLLSEKIKKKSYIWLFTGFSLAYLLTTRLSLQGFIYIMLIYLIYLSVRWRVYVKSLFLISGFLIGSSYILIGNYKFYKVLSLVPPYSMSIPSTMYGMRTLGKNPEQMPIIERLDPHYASVNLEFHTSNWWDIPEKNNKYNQIFLNDFKENYRLYIRNYFQNMIWLWDKYFLIVFEDPLYPISMIPVRLLNIALLAFSFLGLFRVIRMRRDNIMGRFVFVSGCLFLYMTFIYPFVSNETRHTIIFYPVLMIWASNGIVWLFDIINHGINKVK